MKNPSIDHTKPAWEHKGDKLQLAVRVQPRASRTRFGDTIDGRLRVYLTAAPTDGKANAQLIDLVAKRFGVAKSSVQLLRGMQSRNKDLLIDKPSCLPDEFSS